MRLWTYTYLEISSFLRRLQRNLAAVLLRNLFQIYSVSHTILQQDLALPGNPFHYADEGNRRQDQ